MKARPLAVLIWLASASLAEAVTVDALPTGTTYTVKAIRVEGTHHVSKSAVTGAMQLRRSPWYKPWKRWSEKVEFNAAVFRTDLDRVQTLLRESGYYEAHVTHDLVTKNHALEIVIHIEEGPATRTVAPIELATTDFTLPAQEEAALRGLFVLVPGATFTQKAYDANRDRIERYYLEHGFAYVTVVKAAVVDTATHEAHLTYTITRGRPAVFGQTTVDGLADLDEKLVRREIVYKPGEPYDPKKIEKTQASIFGLDLFRSVTVEPSNLKERTGVVDIAIHATQGPPRSIKVGIGYGLEDELRGQLQWQHNNFLGGGRQLGIRLKASFITQAIEGEFRQPYFLHPKQTLVVPLTQTREAEPAFTLAQSRLAPRIERKFPPHVTVSFGYNVEYDDLSGVPDETKQRLDEFTARGVLSGVTLTAERNTASDLLDPHDGSVLTLFAEQAGGPWQGDFTLYRVLAEAKRYIPVFGDRVVATRLRMGAGDGFGQSKDLPMFRRFFAGGINSTRGYDRYKLGPLTSDETPIGGRSLLEGSLEFRTPVYGGLGAVVFLDAGYVSQRPWHYDLGALRYGTGPGIRYSTPVGPLRLDLGIPINPPAGLPHWQIHFSVGQAF